MFPIENQAFGITTVSYTFIPQTSYTSGTCYLRSVLPSGQGGIRTPEGVCQQIYSLPVLTTYLPTQIRETFSTWQGGDSNPYVLYGDNRLSSSDASNLLRQPVKRRAYAVSFPYMSMNFCAPDGTRTHNP